MPTASSHGRSAARRYCAASVVRQASRRAAAAAKGAGSRKGGNSVTRAGPAKLARQARSSAVTASRTRSEEHTSELQSLMRISYAVFCLKKKKQTNTKQQS